MNNLTEEQKCLNRYLSLINACYDYLEKGNVLEITQIYIINKIQSKRNFLLTKITSKEQLSKYNVSDYYLNKYLLIDKKDNTVLIPYENIELEYLVPTITNKNLLKVEIKMNNKVFTIKGCFNSKRRK